MPEGDTILRSARNLDRWLRGQQVTAARSIVLGTVAERLVGRTVESVEARGKHLLMRFDADLVLHTHMRMNGAWHVYRAGARWRRPAAEARLVLEAGPRIAVCFSAPVVELLTGRDEAGHPALRTLGPDVLHDAPDFAEVLRRVRAMPGDTAVGELLLDQRVAAGIGNVYRCESLFVERVYPFAPIATLDDDRLDRLFRTASRLLQHNVARVGRDVGGGADRPWVYRRTGRPCRRCGAAIVSKRFGELARTVYWCPNCQP